MGSRDRLVLAAQAGALLATFFLALARAALYLPYALAVISGRAALGWLGAPPPAPAGAIFYRGLVAHRRRRPREHAFTYPVRMALIDLDSPPPWHPPGAGDTLTAAAARAAAGTAGPVRLLTHPPAAGYVQNPISVYYCYEESGKEVERCLAEVTNTPWGERVTFAFRPDAQGGEAVPKALHVSPLMDMQAVWRVRAPPPGPRRLFLSVAATAHPQYGDYFLASLDATLDDAAPHLPNEIASLSTLMRYGFQSQRVAAWIYWQAVLLLCKRVPFFAPPGEAYKGAAEAAARHPPTGDGRRFVWRRAQRWPWRSAG